MVWWTGEGTNWTECSTTGLRSPYMAWQIWNICTLRGSRPGGTNLPTR